MSASPIETEATTTDVAEHQDSNTEAAKWRRRLRDVEAERDALKAQLADTQRSERITLDALVALGTAVADFLDPDGRIDRDKVSGAARDARDELGINLHAGLYVPAEGAIPAPAKSATFSDAFAPDSAVIPKRSR